MTTLQESVVASARGWHGTRFHHQGRVKRTDTHKGGVDCLGLLIGVAKELELKAVNGTPLIAYDSTEYAHSPNTYQLKQTLESVLVNIPHEGIDTADVVLLNIDGRPQHMGIITQIEDKYGIIHAYAPARVVVEHHFDEFWRGRVENVYRVPG